MIDFGKNIKILNYDESLIDKYKNKDNLLRHARYIPGKTEGIFLIDKRNDSLMGYAAWEGDTLIALEIIKDYQSLGLGKKLLAFCEENGVRKLTVSRKNIPAISLYRKSGWKNSKKQENNKIFYMEKIYTVSLTESELKLFSEFLSQKEFSRSEKKEDIKTGLKTLGLAGSAAGMIGANSKLGNYLKSSDLNVEDAEKIKKKLIEGAKKQGIRVIKEDSAGNAAYVGNSMGKKIRNGLAYFAKRFKKEDPNLAREFMDAVEEGRKNVKANTGVDAFKHFGKDRVIIGDQGSLSKADVLSHELGHAQYEKAGRSKNVIAKVSHKLMPISKIAASGLGIAASFAHGVKSGKKSEKLKKEGKKESLWDKTKAVVVPAALVAPMLIAEGAASRKGIKLMKKSGASKELIKQANKRLGAAWGTYASKASLPVISGQLGREAGRLSERKKNNNKKQ